MSIETASDREASVSHVVWKYLEDEFRASFGPVETLRVCELAFRKAEVQHFEAKRAHIM